MQICILVLIVALLTAWLTSAVGRPRASDGIRAPATLPLRVTASKRVHGRAHVRVTDARRAHAVRSASPSVAHILRWTAQLLRLARFVRPEKVPSVAR